MLGLCESCGYRGSQVVYEPVTQSELCLRCYAEQTSEQTFQNAWTRLTVSSSPQAA